MDMNSICDTCRRFWTGEEPERETAMFGFDRNINDMRASAASGCHCCAIFASNYDLLLPYKDRLKLGDNNRVFVVLMEEMLAMINFFGHMAQTPLRFILRRAKVIEPRIVDVCHETSTGSATSFNQAKEWLRLCRDSHPGCQAIDSTYRPTRLLHIDTTTSCVRLCQGRTLSANDSYATLSHCWGSALKYRLTRETYSSFEQGIALAQLAKTFKEAIEVCQKLQINYIWIDCFCIVQDSPEDWRAESLQMQHVYGNSFLNIAATDSGDSNGGLFRDRDVQALRPFKLSIYDLEPNQSEEALAKLKKTLEEGENPVGHVFYLTDIDCCWDRFENAPLNRRAWVLQERLLSPRVLHYDKDQLWWECDSLTACERFPGPQGLSGLIEDNKRIRATSDKVLRMHKSENPLGQELHDLWRPMMKTYTGAGITKSTDRLIAIDGVAQRLKTLFGCSYVAGLFTRNMESQLGWSLAREEKTDTKLRNPSEAIAPSWSWASYLGEINTLPQWESVDSIEKMRRLQGSELCETILCEVLNKEELASKWSCSAPPVDLRLEMSCFLAQVCLVNFADVRAWTKIKYDMCVWTEDMKGGPVYSRNGLPFDEERPWTDLWPLRFQSGGGGRRSYVLWEGQPSAQILLSSPARTEEDQLSVNLNLDAWESRRDSEMLYLLPLLEVTRYEPQDIFEKVNIREIQGLVLERLDETSNLFRRRGVFTSEGYKRSALWKAALGREIEGIPKHPKQVSTWPDIECEVSSKEPFKYRVEENERQYHVVIC